MMIPTAIRPTRPLLPRSLTSAVILPTTPPKNGNVPPISNDATIASASNIKPMSVSAPIHDLTEFIASICHPHRFPELDPVSNLDTQRRYTILILFSGELASLQTIPTPRRRMCYSDCAAKHAY